VPSEHALESRRRAFRPGMTGGRVGRGAGVRPGTAAAAEGRQPRLAGEELRQECGKRGGPHRRARPRRRAPARPRHRPACHRASEIARWGAMRRRGASFRPGRALDSHALNAALCIISEQRRRRRNGPVSGPAGASKIASRGDRMRRSGAPRAEPTAAMPEATLDPRHGPLDPRKVLTSIGEVVYDWDLASDALAWGANAAEVL